MKTDEDRIHKLEHSCVDQTEDNNAETVGKVLCEIARQLARIADALEEKNQ